MQLGDFQFQISTLAYDQLQRTTEVVWAKLGILNNYERLQATGLVNDRIVLQGKYHVMLARELGATENPIDTVREMALARKPYLLVSGAGNSLYYWVIETVAEEQSDFTVGVPLVINFTLNLTFYGERV